MATPWYNGKEGDNSFGFARPAERALLAAGYDTVEKLIAASDAELLALHGVGPQAIRLLRATRPGGAVPNAPSDSRPR